MAEILPVRCVRRGPAWPGPGPWPRTVPPGLSWVVTAGGRGACSWGPGGGEGAPRQVGEGGQAALSRCRSGNGAGAVQAGLCLTDASDGLGTLGPGLAATGNSAASPPFAAAWGRLRAAPCRPSVVTQGYGGGGGGEALRLPSAPGPAGLGWRSVSSPTPRRGPKSGTASCRGPAAGGWGRRPPRPEQRGRRRPVPSRLPTTPPGEGPRRSGAAPAPRSPGSAGRGGARAVRRGCAVLGAQRHSPRPAGLEMLARAAAAGARVAPAGESFADDVLRVFGANHSLSAGQLAGLLHRLGAAPALGAVLPLAHLHHNQVPRWWRRREPLRLRGDGEARAGLETHVQGRGRRAGWAGSSVVSCISSTVVFLHVEAGREGAKVYWGAGLGFRAKVPVRWWDRLAAGGRTDRGGGTGIRELLPAAVRGCPAD